MGRLLKKNRRESQGSDKVKPTKEKWKKVISGKVWKNTEKTLKRHGMRFLPDNYAMDDTGVSTPEHVRKLYLLHLAAAGIRENQKLSVELCRLPARMKKEAGTEYVILPSSVRRKSSAYNGKFFSGHTPGFKYNLFTQLLDCYGDDIAQELAESLPVTRMEIALAPEFYIPAWFNVSSAFALLMLECSRLNLKDEYGQLSQIIRMLKTSSFPGPEDLAGALFFSMVTPGISEILTFHSFFENDRKMKKQGDDARINAINEYIWNMNDKSFLRQGKIN
ncbi:hypothetical protein FPE53_26375 [Salmonella enterica subsp. enterica]|uniref:Uncharacterized protein n=2 Tax=Salmonella enterica TaxID=28901 RepID=A0A744KEM0_SALER|nr:hypothetical protein [Salmonella enterica subsp. enterica serovar Aqua]ECH1172677.1 hypothetical protein [Salmonella enterica subsp. enterica serovar Aqua]EIK6738961.1 hypothetical protein [Salmonella enterica subsp. enterica serovar Aqua]HAF2609498.1 hypothetical protein [Salmonella enterica]